MNEPHDDHRQVHASQVEKPKLSYSIREAAEATGVSEEQLRKIIRFGHLAAVSPPGFSRLLIRKADLQEWLDSGE